MYEFVPLSPAKMIAPRRGAPLASYPLLVILVFAGMPGTMTFRNQRGSPIPSDDSHSVVDTSRGGLAHGEPEYKGPPRMRDHPIPTALRLSFKALANITRWTHPSAAWAGELLLARQRQDVANSTHYASMVNSTAANGTAVLMALGAGTGAGSSLGGTGVSKVNRELLQRMRYQDKAMMLLLVGIYFVGLWFFTHLIYRQVSNDSPVTYYADPRFHTLAMEGHDLDVFVDTFNQPPKNMALQVTGYRPVPEDMYDGVSWRGENFQMAFTFSLDLSPWVQRATHTIAADPKEQAKLLYDGMLPKDRSIINHVLMQNNNDLAFVELVKEVAWPDWEELATNIKHRIRQSGFNGFIAVTRTETDEVCVYKNKTWANFMHSRATRLLCALSIVGWIVYMPYMWLCCKGVRVRAHYRVEVSISEYWHLIADKLTADGFLEAAVPQVR